MRSAAAAFAWEFRRRLRWGLIPLAAYFVVLAVVQFLVLGPRSPINPARSVVFAFTVAVPLSFAFMYLLAVFSYGLAGDLTARHSLYPARMFTLPVSTAALAGWPMLYGTTVLAAFWVAATLLGLWPSGVRAPLVWPALFAAAFLAWMQVFTWMPYGLPGIRVIAAVLWLTMIDAVVFTAIEFEVRESLMVAIMAPQVPLAYLAARSAVARARRGDVPDWRGAFAGLGRIAHVLPRARERLLSAAHAQTWFEWRQHGRSLPVWTGVVLPFQLLLLFVLRHEPAVLTVVTLAGMLLTPPFLAAFVALAVGRSNPDASDSHGLTSFVATRPLTTAALVAAKLRMALASTLFAWLLVLVAIPLGLTVSGTWPIVVERARRVTGFFGAPRAVVIALLCLLALLATTWKQLLQGLAIGLTGREGLIKSSALLRLSSLALIGPAAHLLSRSPEARIALFNAVPWIPAVLVGLKMCAAGWIATRLSRGRLLGERALVTGAASWLVAVLALYGVLAWLLDTPHIARSFPLLLATLAVPLARPSAVALSLGWSRHRGARPPATSAVNGRRRVLTAALALLGVPAALALVMAASFHVRNRNNGAFVSSGEKREYLLYVPRSYDRTRPTALVISMHGAGLWPVPHMEMSGWNAVADEHGFIVAYPSAVGGRGPRVWRMDGGARLASDVRFIAELIDRLKASHNIDPARIYADGLSNGGGMAFVLSCTLSDRIAAVGLVASAQLLPWSWCKDQRAVPMIAFHGTDDRFTPYHGGTSPVAPPRYSFPSIPTWAASWARRNRCEARPVESAVAADVARLEYTGCSDDAAVVLYTIRGGGHTWPGGGPMPEWFLGSTSRGVDATRQTWAFFRAHPLPSGRHAGSRRRGLWTPGPAARDAPSGGSAAARGARGAGLRGSGAIGRGHAADPPQHPAAAAGAAGAEPGQPPLHPGIRRRPPGGGAAGRAGQVAPAGRAEPGAERRRELAPDAAERVRRRHPGRVRPARGPGRGHPPHRGPGADAGHVRRAVRPVAARVLRPGALHRGLDAERPAHQRAALRLRGGDPPPRPTSTSRSRTWRSGPTAPPASPPCSDGSLFGQDAAG